MPDKTEKPNQPARDDRNAPKTEELPPKQMSDRDAQNVKGGMASSKKK